MPPLPLPPDPGTLLLPPSAVPSRLALSWALDEGTSSCSSERCHAGTSSIASQLAGCTQQSCVRCSRAWRCKLTAAVGSSCRTVPSSCGKTTRAPDRFSDSVVRSGVTFAAFPMSVSISAEYVVFESAAPPKANVTRDQIAAGGGNKAAEAPRSSPSSRSAAKRSSSASPCIRSTRVSYMVSSPS